MSAPAGYQPASEEQYDEDDLGGTGGEEEEETFAEDHQESDWGAQEASSGVHRVKLFAVRLTLCCVGVRSVF